MKNRNSRDEESIVNENNKKKKMKKNMQRLGGGGLSLEAFANAKTKSNNYNPAILKKKREFYKNAKHVSKYKKMLKHQGEQNDPSSSVQLAEEDESRSTQMNNKNYKKGKGSYGLKELYERKRDEVEKARMERETIFQAKKEVREKAEARRKALRENMFKKTRKGQPVMKYRIEHLLETLQRSTT